MSVRESSEATTRTHGSSEIFDQENLSDDARRAHFECEHELGFEHLLEKFCYKDETTSEEEAFAKAVYVVLAMAREGKEAPADLLDIVRGSKKAERANSPAFTPVPVEEAPMPPPVQSADPLPAAPGSLVIGALDAMTGAFTRTAEERAREIAELGEHNGPLTPEMTRRFRTTQRMTRDLEGLATLLGDSPRAKALRESITKLQTGCVHVEQRVREAEKAELKHIASAPQVGTPQVFRALEIASNEPDPVPAGADRENRPSSPWLLKEILAPKTSRIEGLRLDSAKSGHVSERVGAVRAEAARAREGLSKPELSSLAQNLIGQLGEAFGDPAMRALVSELSAAISAVTQEICRLESAERPAQGNQAQVEPSGAHRAIVNIREQVNAALGA